ncbi:MAG: hypothetical protein ACRCZ0_07235 [Cetobacterium sp.]
MDKEPEYFQYKNKNVYDLEALIQYDQAYFYGCLRYKRDAIIKKQIPEEHYFYAKMVRKAYPAPSALTKDGWIESNSKYSKAKILVTEEWAKANVAKLVEKYAAKPSSPKPSTSRLVVTQIYKESPPLLRLEEHEKFRDNEDNIFEVEVRGVREEDKIFFKSKDIENVFEMTNLVKNIRKEHTNYIEKEDYEIFLLPHRGTISPGGVVKKKAALRVLATFLTYNGLLKVIFNSRSGIAYKFRKWATKIIYTAHLGTDEQRVEQALNIAGVNASLVKQVFDTCVTQVPCVYLIYIGAVTKMRKHYPVDLKDHRTGIIYKFGKTKNLHRRLMEHVKEYGGLECSDLKLSQWSPINEKSISQAETQLSHYFNDKKIVFQKHVEIVILGRGDMVSVKGQYLDVYNKYGIVNDMLAISKEKADLARDQLLKEKDEKISELNDRIKYMIEQEKEWKQKEMDWKHKEEMLLEQNTLLLKQLSLKK